MGRGGTTTAAQGIASPPDSGGLLSSRRGSGGCRTFTPGPWDSPEFGDELFTTPVPSPTCSSPSLHPDYAYDQQQQQQVVEAVYGKHQHQQSRMGTASGGLRAASAQITNSSAFDFPSSEMYMREPLVPSGLGGLGGGMGFSTCSAAAAGANDAETCSASSGGYFYDATTCGMSSGMGSGVYGGGGGWDYSTTANGNSNGNNSLGGGYQDFGGLEYSSWDSGVFV